MDMCILYLFIGIIAGIGLVSAWNSAWIIYTDYIVKRERERYAQERADFENRSTER